jgi:hypothetical protein
MIRVHPTIDTHTRPSSFSLDASLLTRGTSAVYFRVLDFKPPPSQLLIGLKKVAGSIYLQNTRDEL